MNAACVSGLSVRCGRRLRLHATRCGYACVFSEYTCLQPSYRVDHREVRPRLDDERDCAAQLDDVWSVEVGGGVDADLWGVGWGY